MFNVKPTTPYRDLKAGEKARRNAGDITQNVVRTVANAGLVAPNLARMCLGRATSWVPSYHTQRLALREVLAIRAEAESRRQEVLQQVATAPESLLDGSHAPPPRHRANVTLQQVQSVLADMGCDGAARELAGQPGTLAQSDLYQPLNVVEEVSDERFRSAVTLKGKGRELLAAYYTRKYGASVEISNIGSDDATTISQMLPQLIAADRRKTGDVRCAHYFGDEHGLAAIYIREGGKEALLFFNTLAEPGFPYGELIATACTRGLRGKSIPVYEHFESIQRDSYSCWSQTMKAAVTVTRRDRDESGNWADFAIPNLIDELEGRRMYIPAPKGVIPVRALPEITRMAQSRWLVAEHSGLELDIPLRDSKHGMTLRASLERYTYDARNYLNEPTQILDYTRQKGQRYAEIVQIEAWSEQIQKIQNKLGQAWGEPQQIEFSNQMKKLVRAAPPDSAQGTPA